MASITKYEGKRGTTYKATVRLKGHPTQTETFKRLTDAKQWARDTESNITNGRHFFTNEARKRTLADLIDRYIRDELVKKPRSEAKQKSQLEWWKKQIGTRTLVEITPALLAECRDKLINDPYVTIRKEKQNDGSWKEVKTERKRLPPTANRYIAALSHAFTVAVKEWRWLERNPFGNVRRNKESEGIVRYLSDDERERLLNACKESRNKLLYLIVLLDISSGGRYSEIMKLTWEDVSFELCRIILRDTKNGETRAVPLVGHAFKALKELFDSRRKDTNLLFPRLPRHGKSSAKHMDIRTAWENAVERAGIKNFRFHDLRHTTASYLAMNGATSAEIAEVLGHKTLQMVKRYAHLSEQHTLSVMEKMNQKIFGS